MKKIYILFIFLHYISIFSQQKIQSQSDFYFYENKGQIVDQEGKLNPKVKYLFNSGGLNVQIKKEGFSYDVYEVEKTKKKKSKVENSLTVIDRKPKDEFNYKFKFHRVDIDFLDANKNPEIIAEGKSTDYENYYNIPGKPEGITEVHRYQKITYKNIYPKVDLVFFKPNDTTKTIEYNFIVNPGGRISDIKMKFKGAKTKLKDGKLSMNLRFGEMQENIPHSWIEEKTSKTDIAVQFKEIEKGVYGFSSSKDFFDKTMVIDPVPTRIWGTYYGGSGNDYGIIETDKIGNAYVVGSTDSYNNIATAGTPQNNYAGGYTDAFIAKLDKDGKREWGTYYGFALQDEGFGADFDDDSNVYFVGTISGKISTQFNRNIFLLKLDSNGFLVFEKLFGGPGVDYPYDISYAENYIYISGVTRSKNSLGTVGSFQEYNKSNESDGFLSKLDLDGNMIWSSYFGGEDASTGFFKIINISNNKIHLLGTTYSNKLFIKDAFQPTLLSSIQYERDGLYVVFSDDGKNVVKSSYVGFDGDDYLINGRIINNTLYITGKFMRKGIDPYKAGIVKVDIPSNKIIENNFWNISIHDCSYVDEYGNTFFSGNTIWHPFNIATPNAYINTFAPYSDFYIKIKPDNQIDWVTYYRGENYGVQLGYITKDINNYIYISGLNHQNTKGIATPGTFQQTGFSNDVYIAKFADCESNVKVSYTPICNGKDLELKAEGGDTYEWFGPNNFHSFQQNPIIKNAQISDSGEYFVRANGANTCGGIFTLNVVVGSPAPPKPDITDSPTINGNCKTTLNAPTATDGCGNKIIAITADQISNFSPGTYIITWKYDDGNGNIFTQTQKVIITSPALPTASSPQTFCATNSPKISDIIITGQNIIWYDASGNILNTSDILIDGITYYATQTINGCESDKLPILIKINTTPLPKAKANQDFCTSRNAQIKDLDATGTSLKFYDVLGNLLPNTTILQDNTSYFVTQTLNNCESPKFEIKVTLSANSLPANDYNLAFCNDTTSHSKTENLTKYQENIITGSSDYSFEYFDQNNNQFFDFADKNISVGTNVFYVKVKSKDGCWKMVNLTLQLNQKPVVNLPENEEFCRGLSVDLDAGLDTSSNPPVKFKNYKWTKDDSSVSISNEQILKVNTAGKYTVEVTNSSDCKNTSSTVVNQSILADILKVEIFNNNAKVLLSAGGDFEFSLDNIIWQDSNEFKNLGNGNHTVFVRTKLGCIIGQMTFTIFNISNSFTPNGDGINETWKIDGMENYPNSEITVFDRQSTTVLHVITTGSFEWNGYYNGRPLPTATYWYIIKVSDGRIFQGSLLIKNRN